MPFEVHIRLDTSDLASIAQSLQKIDAAAAIDCDPATGMLRVSSYATERELLAVFAQAGHPLRPDALVRLPSQCCGGCGG